MSRYTALFLVFVIVAGIYVAFSEISKSGRVADTFSYVKNLFQYSSSTYSSNDGASSFREKDSSNQESPPSKSPNIKPPAGFSVEQLSPYYAKIRISSVSRSYFSRQRIVDRLVIRSEYSNKTPVNITGWRVKGNKSELTIPRAISDFNPASNWTEADMTALSGDNFNFYSSKSPLGRNIRLNKCAGYLNEIYDFTPDLSKNCPSLNRSEIATFDGDCQSLILSLGRCESPTNQEINSPAALDDVACRAYLDKLNYAGCYSRYRADADFYSREWRLWLDKQIPFDPEHDRLILLDKEGLLVDEYIY